MDPLHLLVLSDRPDRLHPAVQALRDAGATVLAESDPEVAAAALAGPGFDGLVLDLALSALDRDGLRRAICPDRPAPPDSLETAERQHIARVLEYAGGNRRKAALLLGIARSTLLHKLRKYGLD